jgi:hypothetical protein
MHSAAGIHSPLHGIAKTTDTRTGTGFTLRQPASRSSIYIPTYSYRCLTNSEIEMQGDGHTSKSRRCSVLRFR